jgi:ferredoxin--NADP+ reductase
VAPLTSTAGNPAHPLRVAVIGAGPAGFYTAAELFKQEFACRVDMYNRLPTPYGLVREGVAPDHQSIKLVTRVFDRIGADERFRFLGNVTVGRDISVDELLRFYHMIVYAVGAESDRKLGIPGEDLEGSHPATIFVGWYNGHPEYADLSFDLSHERVVVIGNGNVAVDVTRILARSVEELAVTDVADHALAALRGSGVREVLMLGRRGPAQAKFTSAELKEFGELDGVDVRVDPEHLELDAESRALVEADRRVRRNVEILEGFAAGEADRDGRTIELRFFTSPVEILGDGRVEAVRVERNRLEPGPDGRMRAVGTGETEVVECGLVLRSIGYKGTGLDGLPFDEAGGVIPNDHGRVVEPDSGQQVPGQYVVGWIKRGPSGVIGTNKKDAQDTVDALLADVAEGRIPEPGIDPDTPGREADEVSGIEALLEERAPDFVSFDAWREIDRAEVARGEPQGRPRVKFTTLEEMLEAAKAVPAE